MIVKATSEGWEIIHQQAHGLLAFQLAARWHPNKRPVYWVETLTALLEHDDGQEPYSGTNHLNKVGAPFQFKAYSMEQCHRMIDIALHKSRWTALMVSLHASFLYEPKRGEDQKMALFLDEQRANQKKWRSVYKITQKEVDYAYKLLQWCDALSLILCNQQIPPEGRQLEISRGPDNKPYFIRQRPDNQTISVDPWPFEEAKFGVHIEVYHVNQILFKNDNELFESINKADLELRKWAFSAS